MTVEDFHRFHEEVIPLVARVVKPGGSICWQTGYHVKKQQLFPLDYSVFTIFEHQTDFILRNRIIWTFGHGMHERRRFSGRHEVMLWFTKGEIATFNLDAVRVPQKYPGKRHYKGPNKGTWSGNPLGKNPSDVWELPHVKAQHPEKENHPCQFPIALAQRVIRSLTIADAVTCDPFAGTGSTGAAALIEGRRFVGAEINSAYVVIMKKRLAQSISGRIRYRPVDRAIFVPGPNEKVAHRPEHFVKGDAHDVEA